jgi:asparagine synthase (glutamine-hydrolysing)
MFQMPYFENIKINTLIGNLQKGDRKMIPYIMPLFMMHIWIKNYTEKFSNVLKLES